MAADPTPVPCCSLAEFIRRLELAETIASIRRRKECALRMSPLRDGRRDPSQLRPMDGAR